MLTVICVSRVDRLIMALLMLQLPALPVTQLAVPPGEKLPLTVAFATPALVVTLRIVTVATACQLLLVMVALPTRDLTATT